MWTEAQLRGVSMHLCSETWGEHEARLDLTLMGALAYTLMCPLKRHPDRASR